MSDRFQVIERILTDGSRTFDVVNVLHDYKFDHGDSARYLCELFNVVAEKFIAAPSQISQLELMIRLYKAIGDK